MNPITQEIAINFKRKVHTVLQRPREFFKCPLTPEDFVAAQHSVLPLHVLRAFQTLSTYPNIATYTFKDNDIILHILNSNGIGDPLFKVFTNYGNNNIFYKLTGEGRTLRLDLPTMARMFGDDKTAGTVQWCRDLLTYNDMAKEGMATLEKILPTTKDKDKEREKAKKDEEKNKWPPAPPEPKGATSFGQIFRILPELLPCFPEDAQHVLRGAKKASRLPQGVNPDVRERIEKLSEIFMRCQLLPEVEFVGDQRNALGFGSWNATFPYRGYAFGDM